MNKASKWLVSVVALLPILGLGAILWRGFHPAAKHQVLAAKSTPENDTSSSSLGVISSSGVPLGNLEGSGSSSGNTESNSGNASSPQSMYSSTPSGSSNSSSSNSSATLDPSKFSTYDQYKNEKNALFGDIKVGTGEAVAAGKTLSVNYSGWLTNGQLFDQNVSVTKPFSFKIGAGTVIPGWEQGISGMKVGGERLVIVPPSVGYGAAGQGPIPANAVMVFDIKLLAAK